MALRRMTRARRRRSRWKDRLWKLAAALSIVTGTYLLLPPLVSSALAAWHQHRLLSQFVPDGPAPPPAASASVLASAVVSAAADEPLPTVTAGAPAGGVESRAAQGAHPIAVPAYRLELPTLDQRFAVLEGITTATLALAPGHYPGTPYPGEMGNAAIAGHRTLKNMPAFFYHLNRLQPGDPIRVVYADPPAWADGLLDFVVQRVFITGPYDLSVLAPTPDPWLTLTTCDPPGDSTKRLVVQARLIRG